ncbi:hypothetical protein [Paraburkholderia sp. RL17-337-BIB-A]|uniref:hypothetical protein n=1 Tax=Paraburkholderia sp. RL17-337-BIB-A TaxID=3031636 RepID=UPI0038BB425C
MDKKIAGYLLASLLDRTKNQQVGTISGPESDALALAVHYLIGELAPAAADAPAEEARATSPERPASSGPSGTTQDWGASGQAAAAGTASVPSYASPPEVELVLDSLQHKAPSGRDVLLCLDFGTAMSKAFATSSGGDHLDLELGKAAGKEGYTLPSSVFIGDDGQAYFGYEAIEKSINAQEAGRERLDSIKSWLSFREDGNLDAELLPKTYNPTDVRLTEGDLLRAYLAFLTDMTGVSLVARDVEGKADARYVRRRFARPCGKDQQQAQWVDSLMKGLLAEAQVLADTFSGQWAGGIPVSRLKAAIDALKRHGERPDHLVAEGVPEPVAVAATPIEVSENRIDAYMVVDAGAGTTDFGLFFALRNQSLDEPKVFQVAASVRGLNYAGDKIDQLLQKFIMDRDSIDATTLQGRIVALDLRRRIRVLKELLFKTGKLEYRLSDSTSGIITREEFCSWGPVLKFAERLEQGFREALDAVDDTYLDYLTMDPVRLQVILTGGSSSLPMLAALGRGYVEVRGRKIQRMPVDATPEWISRDAEEMRPVYPQLAVAIGGAAEELPSTDDAPEQWIRATRPSYVAGRLQITGA